LYRFGQKYLKIAGKSGNLLYKVVQVGGRLMSQFSSQQPSDILAHRVIMVAAMNKALEQFCLFGEGTFGEAISNAARPIADAVETDRILIFRNTATCGASSFNLLYRWDRSAGGQMFSDNALLPVDQLMTEWIGAHKHEEYVCRRLSAANVEDAAVLNSCGAKSLFAAPVFTLNNFWGAVLFLNISEEGVFFEDYSDLTLSFARLCARAMMNLESEHRLAEAEKRTRVMLDAIPLCCQLWTSEYKIIDCNETAVELFGFNNKHEFINGYSGMSPKYQPDGQLSHRKMQQYIDKAFKDGRSLFDWMHQLPDDTLLPVEITFVRVLYKDEFVIAGFTRDIRQIKKMESNILRLESESEKIYIDPLTGIFNRRFFDETLSRLMKTLSRSGGIISLLMIDIDFFKNYNDTYGHSEGDNCLRTVAETLTSSVTRADDFVVRYGGEEFAVVLPNTDEDGARLLADNMLENIRACNIPHENSCASDIVTISIGVTTGKVPLKSRADDFIIRADEMLYMSKQTGRNRSTYGSL